MKNREYKTTDTIGGRCAFYDPVIESRTYGGPDDYYAMIIETTVNDPDEAPHIERVIVPKAPVRKET